MEEPKAGTHVKRVIGIVSGKGGVGKSLVTSLLASAMQKKGCRCAVLDADITGPSIPRMFGIQEKAVSNESGILPIETKDGMKIMSINLLLEHDTDPVVWRGPLIAGAVKQFWTDVCWGDVDYMFVDMPPGTGDVPLTVFQSLPVDGIVVVTSPQELVGMIVGKAVKMAEMLHIPVLGIVENMAYFECPSCHEKHFIFGDSHVKQSAAEYGISMTAQIPVDSGLAAACDRGGIADFEASWLEKLADGIESGSDQK
ncbi:MAG TPA: ATP-binding protein [Lachnospiraceae bacterium]|nr:ATP-binding protein [Lachnospiraceae bacterium]